MKGPTIAVIGAGSYFFGRPIIYKCATSSILNGGTLNLVDTDPKVLETMKNLAETVIGESKNNVKVNAYTDYQKAVEGADFVVLTFSDRNAHHRGIDTEVAKKHGITMCSSDTIGPGGIFRAMREIPKAVEIARFAEKNTPNAWVINFINPTTVLGMALRTYVPGVRSFALCDGLHEPYKTINMCKEAELIDQDANSVPPEILAGLDMKIAGVNHFTWLLRFNYNGKDMIPLLVKKLEERVKNEAENPGTHSKGRYNQTYIHELYKIFGHINMVIGHTKEYVPYFQGYGAAKVKPEPIICFDAEGRAKQMAERWAETEKYASGGLTAKEFLEKSKSDHATDIIESMWGNLGKSFYINTDNNGAVTNLPDEAFLELRSNVEMTGVNPQPVGEFPLGLRGLQMQVLDTHELTAQAAMTGDRDILLRAMLTDPIVNNIEDARNCIEELLELEKDALPDYWY